MRAFGCYEFNGQEWHVGYGLGWVGNRLDDLNRWRWANNGTLQNSQLMSWATEARWYPSPAVDWATWKRASVRVGLYIFKSLHPLCGKKRV
jgi:hypothetical protein